MVGLIQDRIRAEIAPGPWNESIAREAREQAGLAEAQRIAAEALQQ